MPLTKTTKLPPCCARKRAGLVMEEANLRRLAARAAKRLEQNKSIVELSEAIRKSKAIIEESKQAIIDHDASHAGDVTR